MEPLRSVQVNAKLTPQVAARLFRLAKEKGWTRSSTAAWLIKQGFDACDRSAAARTPADGAPEESTAAPAA